MNKTNNSELTRISRLLRRGMTEEERHLWYDFLKNLPLTVRRQKVIGAYIVDFYIAGAKIAIELDGSQHYDTNGRAQDHVRDAYLQELGITVLRYSNKEIQRHFDSVCADIEKHIAVLPAT